MGILYETEEALSERRTFRELDAKNGAEQDFPMGSSSTARERNKSVKRQSIKCAARELFTEMDYEKATVREITARAGVALGTVSLYAEDKRDLILLAYNDEVAEMIARAEAVPTPNASFSDNLLRFFRVFYEGYASNLRLARTYLQINFFSYGLNSRGLALNRQRKFAAATALVRQGQCRAELRDDVKADAIAMQFLFLHSSAVRSWVLDERPSVDEGIEEMRRLIDLQTQGLHPTWASPTANGSV